MNNFQDPFRFFQTVFFSWKSRIDVLTIYMLSNFKFKTPEPVFVMEKKDFFEAIKAWYF